MPSTLEDENLDLYQHHINSEQMEQILIIPILKPKHYLVDMFLLSKCRSWQQASPSEVGETAEKMPPSSLIQPKKKEVQAQPRQNVENPQPSQNFTWSIWPKLRTKNNQT